MKTVTDPKAPIFGPAFRKMLGELAVPDVAPQPVMPLIVPQSKGKGKKGKGSGKDEGKSKGNGSQEDSELEAPAAGAAALKAV